MSKPTEVEHKSFWERVFHALAFEGLALLIFAPIISLLMDRPLVHTAALAVLMSTIAVLWNMVFNVLFDKLTRIPSDQRGFVIRFTHATLFEGGLILIVVPIIAWWMKISLYQSFILDIGLLILFFPYTLLFNWAYDSMRAHIISRRSQKISSLG